MMQMFVIDMSEKHITVLNIPDEYHQMDPKLIAALEIEMESFFDQSLGEKK